MKESKDGRECKMTYPNSNKLAWQAQNIVVGETSGSTPNASRSIEEGDYLSVWKVLFENALYLI